MKGKTKIDDRSHCCDHGWNLLLCRNSGYQYSFIRDMVFHHGLFGDTGSFVPGKERK